jgi:hypothetical protein
MNSSTGEYLADMMSGLEERFATLEEQYREMAARLEAPGVADEILSGLDLDSAVQCLLLATKPAQWCTDGAIATLAASWENARLRALLGAAARRCGLMPAALEGMIQEYRAGQYGAAEEDYGVISGLELLRSAEPPRQDVIPALLPAGCTLLAGNAKDGKSLLAYHLASCVTSGKPFLNTFNVEQGEVLFFALEDGTMRGKERLERQRVQLKLPEEELQGVFFRFWDAPRLGAGFERYVERWLGDHPATRLVVIDILEKVRPRGGSWEDIYQNGYQSTAPLARIAQERNISLLVIHHSNKNPHADPRLLVSGPMSVLGGADNAWLLRRPYGEAEAELIIAGRDIPEQELALHFEAGLWTLQGTLAEARMSRERRDVLALLEERAMRPLELGQALGKRPDSVRSLLRKMREAGQVMLNPDKTYSTRYDATGGEAEVEAGSPLADPAIHAVPPMHAVPDVPGVPDTPVAPVVPDIPAVPLDPVIPSAPVTPSVPDTPVDPAVPLAPAVPDAQPVNGVSPAPAVPLPDHSPGQAPAPTDPGQGIVEGCWIWPLNPTGKPAAQSPWYVVAVESVNNRLFALAQTPTGKLNRWPLEHCQRTNAPPAAGEEGR